MADTGAHGHFPFSYGANNGITIFGFDPAGLDQFGDQLINRLPAVGGQQISDDLSLAQQVA
jgi:hypothetical protein